jgi:uncharacterized protein YaiE (UPF0345 family)
LKHNSYFNGNVQSLGIDTPQGYATVGVIAPGKYTFGTEKQERMEITVGSLQVRVPGEAVRTVSAGGHFIVPPGVSFDVECNADVSYICYYQ